MVEIDPASAPGPDKGSWALTLPRVPSAPQRARRFVTEQVPDLDRLPDVVLAVSELVSNAVENATSPTVKLRLSSRPSQIRVEVVSAPANEGVELPPPRLPNDDRLTGRGLRIVSTVTDRMGMSTADTTSIWFELDC